MVVLIKCNKNLRIWNFFFLWVVVWVRVCNHSLKKICSSVLMLPVLKGLIELCRRAKIQLLIVSCPVELASLAKKTRVKSLKWWERLMMTCSVTIFNLNGLLKLFWSQLVFEVTCCLAMSDHTLLYGVTEPIIERSHHCNGFWSLSWSSQIDALAKYIAESRS